MKLVIGCTVIDILHKSEGGLFAPIALHGLLNGRDETMQLEDGDLVFLQSGSLTDASSLGSMATAPAKLNKGHNGAWVFWEKLAEGRPSFGKPAAWAFHERLDEPGR